MTKAEWKRGYAFTQQACWYPDLGPSDSGLLESTQQGLFSPVTAAGHLLSALQSRAEGIAQAILQDLHLLVDDRFHKIENLTISRHLLFSFLCACRPNEFVVSFRRKVTAQIIAYDKY